AAGLQAGRDPEWIAKAEASCVAATEQQMATQMESMGPTGPAYVDTGHLPPAEQVRTLVAEAYEHFRTVDDGENAAYYPALAQGPRDRFGVCVAGVDGTLHAVGDAESPFTIMSVSKPFVFALVCQALGAEEVRAKVGVNSTGLPFNSVMALELHAHRLTNPMVNTGALATTSLVPGATAAAKWQVIHEGLSRFAGRRLALTEECYPRPSATNPRTRGRAAFLAGYGRLYFDAVATVDLYTRQSSLNVTARDLAVMGATLADGGVNSVTRERVIEAATCQ